MKSKLLLAEATYHELLDQMARVNPLALLPSSVLRDELKRRKRADEASQEENIHHKGSVIISLACNQFNVKQSEITSGKREAFRVTVARHVTLYTLRKRLSFTLQECADAVSLKDHGSVLYAITRVNDDPDLVEEACQLIKVYDKWEAQNRLAREG